MLDTSVRPSTLDGIKRLAKSIKLAEGCNHTTALNLSARQAGFSNFKHAQNSLRAKTPTPPDFIVGPEGTCALCDAQNVTLIESHSIPKFVYDWIKNTSKTPYIRSIDDVNNRKQDGPKEYLLCKLCEQKLSATEKMFSEGLFKKIANYRIQASAIAVTEMHRICVLSIFWRALLTTKNRSNSRTTEDNKKLDAFLAAMKTQINEGHCNYKIYVAPFWGAPPYYGLTPDMTYMLERSTGGQDIRFFDKPHRFYAVFSLPFMCFYIFSPGWGTEQLESSTELIAGNLALNTTLKIPSSIRWYLEHQFERYQKSLPLMNQYNLDRIKSDADKNLNITGSDKSIERSKLSNPSDSSTKDDEVDI